MSGMSTGVAPALAPPHPLILDASEVQHEAVPLLFKALPAMRVLCLAVALALALAACPRVLSRDVKVIAQGYSWLENLLPTGAPLPLLLCTTAYEKTNLFV
jgi:hypothetical protein